MNTRKFTAPVAALALLAGTSAYALQAYAADEAKPANPVAQATKPAAGAEDSQYMKISDEAYTAMRDVRAARLAIFNGDTEFAKKLVAEAKAKMDAADKDAVALGKRPMASPDAMSKGSASGSDANASASASGSAASGTQKTASSDNHVATRYIPIDAQLMVSEDFVNTPEKAQHVAKANEHLKSGNPQAAKDELKLADVEVTTVWALAPADATMKAVDKANDLIGQQKWYEANLALKSAEDGIVVEALGIEGVPAPAGQAEAASAGQQHAAGKQTAGQQSAAADTKDTAKK